MIQRRGKGRGFQKRIAMHAQLSGVIAPRPSQQEVPGDDTLIEVTWRCRVCGKTNKASDEDDDSNPERCRCCGRDRDPLWLWLEKYELQIQVGTQLRLSDHAAFGTRVGVVSGIDFVKRRIEVLAISSRQVAPSIAQDVLGQREVKSASGRSSRFRFESLEYTVDQLQELIPTPAESTDQVEDLRAALEHHGLCGDCRRVFRVAQGDVAQVIANREAIESLQDELCRVSDLKKQNIKLREYDRVLENTSKLQSLKRQLSSQKRTLEFLSSLFCPHCGWRADPH